MMTIAKVPQKHYPKADIWRRALALGLDFLGAWLVSLLFGSSSLGIQLVQILVFIFCWLILRVVVVFNNRGQSLGRWAFDLKILEVENDQVVGRVPELLALVKRETIICFGALLVAIALANLSANPTAILLVFPIVIDCGAAFSDKQLRQALHDRYARTFIVSSRRGYSLDIKIKKLVDTLQRNVRR